ncbi:hypothetical protein VI06_03340 [Aquitalea magnusonii]|nr:hypothetical protein VI06_03340 [Aquitalea magnusonii]
MRIDKNKIDPQALASFTAQAGKDSEAEHTNNAPHVGNFPWRFNKATSDLLEEVFAGSTVKSKQKLLDDILLPELIRRRDQIRNK